MSATCISTFRKTGVFTIVGFYEFLLRTNPKLAEQAKSQQIELNMLRLLLFILLRCHCLCLLAFFASPATASASASHSYSHLSSTSLSAPSTSPSRPHLISFNDPSRACSHNTCTHSSPFHPTLLPISPLLPSHIHHFCDLSSNDDDHAIIDTYIYICIYVFLLMPSVAFWARVHLATSIYLQHLC